MKFIAIFALSMTLAIAECGLTNWFHEWTDELTPPALPSDTKCREKREDAGPVSLMDIETASRSAPETRVANGEDSPKAKRCPKAFYLKSSRNPSIVGRANPPLPLVKRESEARLQQDSECAQCMNERSCQESGLCHCKHLCSEQEYIELLPETVGSSGSGNMVKSSEFPDIFSRTLHPAGTFRDGPVKALISAAVGAADPDEIELVSVWMITRSNEPPDLSNLWYRTRNSSNDTTKKPLGTDSAALREQWEVRTRHGGDREEELLFPSGTKVNPRLIEAPPPFVRSTHSQKPTVEPIKTGPLHSEIIVEPAQFLEEQPPTVEGRGGRPEESTQSKDMDRALSDAKSMIEDMQERAANGDLLGQPASTVHYQQQAPVLNPHIVEGIHDINNYLLNRAQDTLDTIGQRPATQAQNQRDAHSDMTKKMVNDLKKVPQYVLGRIQDTIKQPAFTVARGSQPEPEDPLVGEPKKKPWYAQGSTEPATTYIDDMIYFVSDLPPKKDRTATVTAKPSRLMEILGSLKPKRPLTTSDTSTYPPDYQSKIQPELIERFNYPEAIEEESDGETEAPPSSSTTTESARDLLKNKIRSYIETLKRSREEKLQAATSSKLQSEPRIFQGDSLVKTPSPALNITEVEQEHMEEKVAEQEPEKETEQGTQEEDKIEDETEEEGELEDEMYMDDFHPNLGTFFPAPDKESNSSINTLYFIGAGMKLPIETRLNSADGSLELRLDLEKLCNCQNISCPKNHTKIEETVGVILEKEAELEEQLHEIGVDQTKSNIAKRSPEDAVAKHLQSTVAESVRNLENTVEQFNRKVAKALNGDKNGLINGDALLKQINKDLAMNKKNFNWNVNDYVKKLEREKVLRKLMQQLNIAPHRSATLDDGLKRARTHANDMLESNQILIDTLTNGADDNSLLKPVQDIHDKLSSVYQTSQINALEDKLKTLNNKLDKYERENEKLFIEESGRVMAGPNSKVIQKEVNLVSKILAWLNHLSDSDNDNKV